MWESFTKRRQDGLINAGIQIADQTLDLTQTFTKPSKNPEILTKDLLLGFSFVAAATFAFVPVIGPLAGVPAGATLSAVAAAGGTAGAAVGGAGGFLGNSLSSGYVTNDVEGISPRR